MASMQVYLVLLTIWLDCALSSKISGESSQARHNLSSQSKLTAEESCGDKVWKDDQLFVNHFFYMLHLDHIQATLRITDKGEIKWVEGHPNLYSVFREQVVHDKSSGDRMYTLEAVASRHLICMSSTGRLYTIKQNPNRQRRKQRADVHRLRHERRRRRNGNKPLRQRRQGNEGGQKNDQKRADCFFKNFEFDTKESYERLVGVYSYTHSNVTHGQFLSISKVTGKPRSYRKAFRSLYKSAHLKLKQIPIHGLKRMVDVTRFGKENDYNQRVRKCIIRFRPKCTEELRLRNDYPYMHLFTVVEKCKRRVRRKDLATVTSKTRRRRQRIMVT